jgi:2-methylcitrate dehydratase PrpD
MTVSETLSAFITSTEFADLGASQVDAARQAIGDCHGCTVAGAATPTGAIIRRVAEASSARGASTVIGGTLLLSAQAAALVNGTAAHALDYDDILWTQYGHPSVTVWSAALAVGESVRASGQDVILAFAIGVQINGKLGRLVNPSQYAHGWHATATIGVIGATAAVCKLMRLTAGQTAMALGIAASEACGVRRNFGTMTKPFHAGNAARGAVLAAELAREGFTSDLTAFEGEFGWAATLNARSLPSAPELAVALRTSWELDEPGIVLKRYPACGATHCALDAIIAIKKEHALDADEIEQIVCEASPFAKTVLLYSRPDTALEAKFSMEFSLAVAAIEGRAGLEQYSDAWAKDPRVRALLARTVFRSRDDLSPNVSADAVPAEVHVHARGTVFSHQVRVPSGDPRNPMTPNERLEKFVDCVAGSYPADQAREMFDNFERLDQFTSLDGLVQPTKPASASCRTSQAMFVSA